MGVIMMSSNPKILLVGGPDVDARLELMHSLKDKFELGAMGSEPNLEEKFSADGFRYYNYPLARGVNPFVDLLSFARLFWYFRTLKPHIVHTFDTKPGVWGRLAARLAGVPVVIGSLPGLGSLYVNDSLPRRVIRSIYQQLQKLACRYSDLTIFQNNDDAEYFKQQGLVSPNKVMVIPGSGVNTRVFASNRVQRDKQVQLREEFGFLPGDVVVTMISRVIRSKGVLEFMAAARAIKKEFPKIRFLLVGPEDKDNLDRLSVEELAQLKQHVLWTGARQDVPDILGMSDIFVLPSAYREGIPRVLLEAASMGLPIVTTNSPGCKEVVENGENGYLVPVRDADALKEAILRLIAEPELCRVFGQVSRQRAVERFEITVIADQTSNLYRQMIPG